MKNFIQWLIRKFSKKAKELYNKPLVDIEKTKAKAVERIETADTDHDNRLSIKEIVKALNKLKNDLIKVAKDQYIQ